MEEEEGGGWRRRGRGVEEEGEEGGREHAFVNNLHVAIFEKHTHQTDGIAGMGQRGW